MALPGSDSKRNAYWPQLLKKVADGSVVPIVGRDLLTVHTDESGGPPPDSDTTANLYPIMARRLGAALGVDANNADLSDGNPLNSVACQYITEGGDPDLIYGTLWDIVSTLSEIGRASCRERVYSSV